MTLQGARIGQIAVVCKDVARATTFYRDILGVRFLFSAGPHLSFFDAGGTRLMLTVAETPGIGASLLYYFVNDIQAVHDGLVANGVKFMETPKVIAKMPDHELWLAAFYDSEDNLMGIMEEKR
jgi:methylmalonyl-CoA/ethylmalonyl-CoA epimerase